MEIHGILPIRGQQDAQVRNNIHGIWSCLEGHGDLVSRLIASISHIITPPSFGFSARGSLTGYSRESLVSAVTKTAARAKSLGGIVVLVEATLPGPTPSAEGGQVYLHATCRDSGRVRCGDHFLIADVSQQLEYCFASTRFFQ